MNMVNIKTIAVKYSIKPDDVFTAILSYGNKINYKLLTQVDGEVYAPKWLWKQMQRVDGSLSGHVFKSHEIKTKLQSIETGIRPSVYFLFDGGELVYIGQSRNVYGRINEHLKDRDKVFDAFAIFSVPSRELLDIEQANIDYYKPKYNKQGKLDKDYQLRYVLSKCRGEGLEFEAWDD